jgi:hypothetical protein
MATNFQPVRSGRLQVPLAELEALEQRVGSLTDLKQRNAVLDKLLTEAKRPKALHEKQWHKLMEISRDFDLVKKEVGKCNRIAKEIEEYHEQADQKLANIDKPSLILQVRYSFDLLPLFSYRY